SLRSLLRGDRLEKPTLLLALPGLGLVPLALLLGFSALVVLVPRAARDQDRPRLGQGADQTIARREELLLCLVEGGPGRLEVLGDLAFPDPQAPDRLEGL